MKASNPVPRLDAERSAPFDPFEGTDNRLGVFVPAVMTVGLVFSAMTLLRDATRWATSRSRRRRTVLAANQVVADLVGSRNLGQQQHGLFARPAYLVLGMLLLGIALAVVGGSIGSFVQSGEDFGGVSVLLAVALLISMALLFFAATTLVVFATWPNPPGWTEAWIRALPLTRLNYVEAKGPPWPLSAGVALSGFGTLLVSAMVVIGNAADHDLDEAVGDWFVGVGWMGHLDLIDVFGLSPLTIGFVVLVGLSSFRCRVMAASFPAGFVLAWASVEVLQDLAERERPTVLGDLASYPSGHMVQSVFIAGLVPLAIRVLLDRQRLARVTQTILVLAAVATAAARIHQDKHWPLDVLGGALLGLTIVLLVHWTLAHRELHAECDACPWSLHPAPVGWNRGVIALPQGAARFMGHSGAVLALTAAVGLGLLTVTVGIPTDPEGSGFGSAIATPAQLVFATLVGVGGLLAFRWRAPGAFLVAIAAMGLGLLAAVEYQPLVGLGLTVALVVPAVLIWFGWQQGATLGAIAALAAVTSAGLTATGLGAREINEYFFGPTHPPSQAQPMSGDAEWLWVGGVTESAVSISAGGFPVSSGTTLQIGPVDGAWEQQVVATTDDFGTARFSVGGLTAETEYRFQVSSETSNEPSVGTFATFATGAQDMTVALGACARRSSNGRVFDAIVAEQPDLFLALGDLHYGNLESDEPGVHVAEYARSLSTPGQAALFASTPSAYVWDDHDFGPNDAGADASSRTAVSAAYRSAVPHYGVDPNVDASIAQAFTVGRVRFVLTDTRSQRTSETMLGEHQLDWLLEELRSASATHALVIWANPTPWIAPEVASGDDWGAYTSERQRIADEIADAGITNLIMVSGDAHMVAFDDGLNSGYAADGTPGFPVFHAGALDRPGSVKGGPYSHGSFPGAGQFGIMEIVDDGGDTIEVVLRGETWNGTNLITHELTFSTNGVD